MLPGESRTFNGFLVGGLLGAFALAPFSDPHEALVAAPHSGFGQTLFGLLASHAVAFGAGFLAARTSGVRERFVAAGSVWVGAVLLASAGVADCAAVGLPTALTLLLVSTGSWAAIALLGGALARRRRLRREGRSGSG